MVAMKIFRRERASASDRAASSGTTPTARCAELGEIGAGIQTAPNASRILIGLGLRAQLEAIRTQPEDQVRRLAAQAAHDKLVTQQAAIARIARQVEAAQAQWQARALLWRERWQRHGALALISDLCAEHAGRLTAPRGWEVVRLDTGAPPPESHDDLVAHGGIYHRLWTAWSAGRRATAVDSAPDPA